MITTKLKIKEERSEGLKQVLLAYQEGDYEGEENDQFWREQVIHAIKEASLIVPEMIRTIPVALLDQFFEKKDVISYAERAIFYIDRSIRIEKWLPVDPLPEVARPDLTSSDSVINIDSSFISELKTGVQVLRYCGILLAALFLLILGITSGSKKPLINPSDEEILFFVLLLISFSMLRKKWVDKITASHLSTVGLSVRWTAAFLMIVAIPGARDHGYNDVVIKAAIAALMLVPRFQQFCENMADGKGTIVFRGLYWTLIAFFAFGVVSFVWQKGIQ